jgi:hypothetical protein
MGEREKLREKIEREEREERDGMERMIERVGRE